ncbi:MFS transporter [Schaedlerella arabinosiphila]|jgi:sugar (Glycoside-Pentoside-Hexuronide) transporter|uniref:MFS transporter n=1 Tax=Schaedlerella arabinosiphila TaxID=2044587 RepID=A0A9X5CCN9_9FIRM|nr:MFS transporter [Schaedlerella arabinosiphila]KAI4439825.1 Isoprimeverose transporter [Schaedlerella arabinosiphila]MCI8769131.1 MFS transporter [Ruminococcus sp.]NDO72259.1 MFS transporter [Schaedlerella arabinosiphila]
MNETKINKYGMEPLTFKNYFVYGMGNFASQLSWTMVGTYLSIFYTDVFGLGVGAVAMLMLIAKVWDGINDPMMGTIMERTHTRWGRFRPYIFAGAPLLVVFTILTFTVPGFGGPAKLIYAYVTYIGLGMAYTMTNVPYTALPAVMTHDPKEVNRLNAAQMMGMTIGQIVLNLTVLPLVTFIGGGDQANGYQKTATLLAIVALPMFWAVAVMSKEKVTVEKKEQGKVLDGLKMIAKNKNLLCAMFYSFFNMFGILGRISVAVFFYMHCVQNFALITVFMMMQMAVGTLVMPFAPKFVEKFGKRNGAIISMVIQGAALLLLYFGPSTSIPFNFLCMIIYGTGYIAGPSGSGMIVDAIDDFDDKYGVRNDGMAFSFNGTAIKIATAIANSVFLLVMGAFGYVGGGEITPHVQTGINLAANLLPGIVFLIGIIPLALYDLDKPGYMEAVRERLTARNAEKKAEE